MSTSTSSPGAASEKMDWAAVLARVEDASRASVGRERSPEQIQAVLRERARELAAPLPHYGDHAGAGEGALETVIMRLGSQVYAIEAATIREAVDVPRITPLPGLPPTLRGLANVRSRIVPAFDIRPLLNLPPAARDAARETMLLLTVDGTDFGLLVDAVLGVRAIGAGELRREVAGLQAQYLQGVTDEGHILLDIPSLAAALTDDERDH